MGLVPHKKVGEAAYKLDLLAHSKVHPVFHVSHLRKRLIGLERPMDDSVLLSMWNPQYYLMNQKGYWITTCYVLAIKFGNKLLSSGRTVGHGLGF